MNTLKSIILQLEEQYKKYNLMVSTVYMNSNTFKKISIEQKILLDEKLPDNKIMFDMKDMKHYYMLEK